MPDWDRVRLEYEKQEQQRIEGGLKFIVEASKRMILKEYKKNLVEPKFIQPGILISLPLLQALNKDWYNVSRETKGIAVDNDVIGGLLLLVVAALVWLALEVRRVHTTIEPLATSSLARGISAI